MARIDSKFGSRAVLATLALALAAVPVAGAFATAEGASAEGASPALTAEQVAAARQKFQDNGCNACHTLADANAAGAVGPSFDGNANLDKAHVIAVVTNGQGPMPSFSWLGDEDIDLIAAYVVQVKK
jgi:mono/diheme cytochrome c family protein